MRKVLVVDDNSSTLMILNAYLKSDFKVVCVSNGMQALEKLETEHFDCVITDMQMPSMTGLELLIKTKATLDYVPGFILFAAYDSYELAIKFIQEGGDDFIPKPVKDKEHLHAKVHKAIHNSELKNELEITKKMLTEIEYVNKSQLRDIQNLTHDFSNCIGSIMGYSELIRVQPNKFKEHSNQITKAAMILSSWLTDLKRTFLNQKIGGEIGTFNLTTLILEVFEILKPMTEGRIIDLKLNSNKDLLFLGSKSKMTQIFLNLFKNAFDHGKLNQEIRIDIEENEENVCITFENTGEFISTKNLLVIFKRFSQSVNSKGSGIGLDIINECVKDHNGTLEAFNKEIGPCFKIILPKTNISNLI